MRLTPEQIAMIRRIGREEAGESLVSVRLFGSRLDDAAKGGDVDLLVEIAQPVEDPAAMTPGAKPLQRLQFLARVVDREARHLWATGHSTEPMST